MSGIMRAPSFSAYFEIPYSGTHALGDCILVMPSGGSPIIDAYYDGIKWVYDENSIDYFSDENNVISFNLAGSNIQGSVAFIPGPNHV